MRRSDASTVLGGFAAELRPSSLDEVQAAADLQTRTDRKYLLPLESFEAWLDGMRDSYRVLEIAGLRVFRYESVYFDTPELASYYGAARGRRRRFKVRTRTYLDSRQTVLEVKTVGGRGETSKVRIPYPVTGRFRIDDAGAAFVDGVVGLANGARALAPVLTTTYVRTTLVDLENGARVTCDADLAMTGRSGGTVAMRDHLLLETKTTSAAGAADRLLWRLGVRPTPVSKYAVGLAALDPTLPANRWNRTLERYFGA